MDYKSYFWATKYQIIMLENREDRGNQLFGGKILKKMLNMPAVLLIVLWGWAQFANYLRYFAVRVSMFSYLTDKILEYLTNGFVVIVFLFTLNFAWLHRGRLKGGPGRQVLIVWVSLILSMVATNLMLNNVLHSVVFELQHALFMLLTSGAILVTSLIIQSRFMRFGAVLFALTAIAASYLSLKFQMALEAFGWLVAFVLPGHALLYKALKRRY
jgi:hypothetical protein